MTNRNLTPGRIADCPLPNTSLVEVKEHLIYHDILENCVQLAHEKMAPTIKDIMETTLSQKLDDIETKMKEIIDDARSEMKQMIHDSLQNYITRSEMKQKYGY